MGEATIKVLENTHTKNRRLKIEAVTKMSDCFALCQNKTEEPKKIDISTPISVEA